MKKILLFALPLMVMSFASCNKWTDDSPIIQFKDPYFLEAALHNSCRFYKDPINKSGAIDFTSLDKNGDGQISEKEASVAVGLDLSGGLIRNSEELKYFTALTYLYWASNPAPLDLSNNHVLKQLHCGGGWSITSYLLTSLDLSNNTALTYLDCNDNQLTSLDLSRCTALTDLDCSNNQLTALDLSKNTALRNLDCSGNQLQKIILYKYHMVNTIEIESEYGDIIEYVE